MWNHVERRADRSTNLDASLRLLLRSHRQRGEFDLIVLATHDGVVVASDGPRIECEELAAYAPFLARGRTLAVDPKRVSGVTVHSFLVNNQELVLAIRGGSSESLTSALALASIQAATRMLRG